MDRTVARGFPFINVSPIHKVDPATHMDTPELTDITTVHIPSLNYPRIVWASASTAGTVNSYSNIANEYVVQQPCQSYIVDVYKDKLVLKGFESSVAHDKKYGDILNDYIYTIDLESDEPGELDSTESEIESSNSNLL